MEGDERRLAVDKSLEKGEHDRRGGHEHNSKDDGGFLLERVGLDCRGGAYGPLRTRQEQDTERDRGAFSSFPRTTPRGLPKLRAEVAEASHTYGDSYEYMRNVLRTTHRARFAGPGRTTPLGQPQRHTCSRRQASLYPAATRSRVPRSPVPVGVQQTGLVGHGRARPRDALHRDTRGPNAAIFSHVPRESWEHRCHKSPATIRQRRNARLGAKFTVQQSHSHQETPCH